MEGLGNFFCKKPDSKCFRSCGPQLVCVCVCVSNNLKM